LKGKSLNAPESRSALKDHLIIYNGFGEIEASIDAGSRF